jgi:tRNA A-37 threonylcarbamoyl transferase component Bud32
VLGGEVQNFSNPFAVLASPAWRGVEADIWKTDANGRAVIVKHYHPDTGFYVDPALAIEAAANAGALGVSPAVLGADASEGLVVFEALSDDWRCGGLQDAVVPDLRHATIAAKKRFQSGPGLSRNISVFEEIARFATLVAEGGITTHRHLPLFLDLMEKARARIAALGVDTRPCHRDGNTANLMIGPQGQVRLVDFDLAANCDPYEDMGCFLMEFFDGEQEARAGFEEWEGRFDEGLFQRAMVYGMADDLRWGLIGSILAERSPRQSLEFAKYASWRFMRLETMALSSHAADRLRHLN